MRTQTDCIDCPAGSYCKAETDQVAAITPRNCSAGYYCDERSREPDPEAAAAGYYAPEQSAVELRCPPGTFAATTGLASCTPCSAGHQCPATGLTAATACDGGYLCEEGTIHQAPCPRGTYQPSLLDNGEPAGCSPCAAGSYCSSSALTAVEGDCAAGYLCTEQSPAEKPAFEYGSTQEIITGGTSTDTTTLPVGLCHEGHYCTAAATEATPCAAGTY
jgi:hypothetical protein